MRGFFRAARADHLNPVRLEKAEDEAITSSAARALLEDSAYRFGEMSAQQSP
jgi:hypothetical protein